MQLPALFAVTLIVSLLTACGSQAPRPATFGGTITQPLPVSEKGNEVALYALGLIDTGYRFGGRNPEAGLDCSGMVSFIYGQAAGLKIKGSAADIARSSRPIEPESLRPGDLVFFNTMRHAFSHVGIYVGDGKFIHSPRPGAEVRVEDMRISYWKRRFDGARRVSHSMSETPAPTLPAAATESQDDRPDSKLAS